ncbi:hypothetical protein [Nocardioides dilutus]
MSALKRPLVLVLSAALLVLGFDLATYAATGDSLIVGKANKANKVTVLKRTTGGAVLSLKAKKNSPPLAVNSTTRVKNLNADLLDGYSSDELPTSATTVRLGLGADSAGPNWNVSMPDGTYLVNWQAYLDLVDSGSKVLCGFAVGTDYVATTFRPSEPSFIASLTGSGVITFGPSTNELFFCNIPGQVEAFAGTEGIDLTFQKLASNPVTDVAANPKAAAPRGSR